jgi:hypothetical protein
VRARWRAHGSSGSERLMVWVILIVLLVAIFGVGTVLEVAFWFLAVLAAVAIAIAIAAARVLGPPRAGGRGV